MTPKCLAVKTARKKLSLIEMQRSEEELVWKKISRKHFYSCEFEMSTNLYTYPNLHISIYLFFFSLKKKKNDLISPILLGVLFLFPRVIPPAVSPICPIHFGFASSFFPLFFCSLFGRLSSCLCLNHRYRLP